MILSPEKRVNTFRTGEQTNAQAAVLADGGYVITWQSQAQDGSGMGIYAQRFAATGAALGPEFRVNTGTGGNQSDPQITSTADGGFVITWTDDSGADGSSYGVLGQRYSATGTALGGNSIVNTVTGNAQFGGGSAAWADGYVTTWGGYNASSGTYDIVLQRWDNAGNKVGSETLVGTATGAGNTAAQTGSQLEPDIASNAAGNQVVVWTDQGGNDSSSYGVYGRRYNASTNTFGDTFLITTFVAGNQYEPDVAMAADGSFVVVWRSDSQDGSGAGVYGQRFNADGSAAGTEFRVNEATDSNQYQPQVTVLSTGGFVVTWYDDSTANDGSGTNRDVYLREYNAAGAALGGEIKLASQTSGYESQPTISDLGAGRYLVVYTDESGDAGSDIVQQIFGPEFVGPIQQSGPVIGDFEGSITFAENTVNAAPQLLDIVVALTDLDSSNLDGGRLDLYYVQGGSSADQLGVRSVGTGPNQISVSGASVLFEGVAFGTLSGGANGSSLSVVFNANATVDAVEELIQQLNYGNSSQSPAGSRTVGLRVSDGDGGASAGHAKTILVTAEADGEPALYGESTVNTFLAGSQSSPIVATLADGSYVVVWQSTGQANASDDVYFQRFNASGLAVGPEVQVNTATGSSQERPHVAALSNGGFVITWDDNAGNDGSGWGVFGQRYDAQGQAQGGNFIANTFTSSTQQYNDVAGWAGAGAVGAGFGVVWASAGGNPGSSGWEIYLQRHDNAGNKVGGELRVSDAVGASTAQGGTQYTPAIAAHANGNLVIVWRDDSGNDGSGVGVFGRQYDAAAGSFGPTFQLNTTTTGSQYEVEVATLSDGGFVAVWRSDSQDGSSAGVYGQRFDAAGTPVGAEFLVNETTAGGQYQPKVVGLSTGGFVVSFYNDNYDLSGTGTQNDVYIRQYDAAGVAIDSQRKLVSLTNSTESEPALADLGNGNFVVVYTDYNTGVAGANNTNNIVQQIFGNAAELPRQANPTLGDFTGSVSFSENLVNAAPQVIDSAVSLNDSDSANFAGGRLDLYYVQGGDSTDQLGVRNVGTGAGQIGVAGSSISYGGVAIGTLSGGGNGANLRIDLAAGATPEAMQALVQNLTYASSSQSPAAARTVGLRVSDGDGGSTEASVFTINVTRQLDGQPLVWGEEAVNTYTVDAQDDPEIGVLADGGYVIVWTSAGQDGNVDGVYMQRYNGVGVAVGGEIRVNTLTAGQQQYAHVAGLTGAGGGGWVVTWQDNTSDGSGWGIYGQRYDASGVAVGGQFLVNTVTASNQYHDAVASYEGGFAVVWSSTQTGGSGHDIYLKRYDNSGALVTAETRVSVVAGSPQAGAQELPDVAAYANGNLVMVWQDTGSNDGSSNAVYGRLYNAAGGTFGDTFLVNTTTADAQYEPSVAVLADGGFVVTWRSNNQDGSSAGVYAQVFNAAGTPVGSEFLVNESTGGGQYQAAVTGLAGGGFVVSWYNDAADAGTSNDVFVREFTSTGVAIDGERKLLSSSNSTEYQPAIAGLASGGFVVAYADYVTTAAGGNNTYGIAQQLFGNPAALARQASPVLGDFTGSVSFAENLVNSTPQLIDAAVALVDTDSTNFDGGRLDLFYVQGGESTDQLGVRNVGNGAGQIGVAGSTISYGGVAIGTVAASLGGANGSALRIDFNTNASVEAVEALVQSLTYGSSSQGPALSRTVGLRVTDGDGGSTAPSAVTINVTPGLDGAPLVYGESLGSVNTHRESTQEYPEVAVLTDGSYVVTWTSSGQDGSASGIYAQRYTASGVALGNEFRVNTVTANTQEFSQITALSNGGFAIVWQDNNGSDGSSWGVIGQLYDAGGAAVGGNFAVNTTSNGNQYHGAVAGYTGGFATVWSSSQGAAGASGHDIYLRRFDNSGTQVTAELRVNNTSGSTAQASTQELPDVAAQANGNLMIVWQDQGGLDGSAWGVFGRFYDASTGTLGPLLTVSTQVADSQYEPSVAALSNGGFVAVWRSNNQDGASAGVFGQLFDATGAKLGGEFLVNQRTEGGQYQPEVIGLSTGGFVVTWYNDNTDVSGTGTQNDVYIREFNNAGQALDGERKLPSLTNSTEYQPAIADLGNGNFVVAYSDYNATPINGAGGNTYEIRTQIFGDAAELVRNNANPVLGDVRLLRTLTNAPADTNFYAGTARVIDTDLSVSDSDSANFDGGQLAVFFTAGLSANDALGLRNEGTGAGQVGVSGADVSYGGTVIGTYTGGGAGVASLVVSFNANATAAAVRAVGENITYLHTAPPAGTTDRYVGLRLTDGDGGASDASVVQLRIQASFSAPVVGLEDVNTSLALTEAEAQAGVLLDADVQLNYTGSNWANGKLTVTYLSSSSRIDDQLNVRHEGNGAGQVGVAGSDLLFGGVSIGTISATLNGVNGTTLDITWKAAATEAAIERVIENLRYSNASSGPLAERSVRIALSDGAGNAATARDVAINITAEASAAALQPLLGTEQQVNTYESGQQQSPSVARLFGSNDGDYVITWASNTAQDGDDSGVYAQRYDSNGAAIGPEFQVNTTTLNAQAEPVIGALAGGGFVIAWRATGQDGSGSYGVYAQRYNADGSPAGTEFLANNSTLGNQYEPAVLGLSDGSFLIAYRSDYTGNSNLSDVLAQRFAADGTLLGAEFTLNTAGGATQYQPQLAALSGGGFVAVWTDTSGDASGSGIVGQLFTNAGVKVGSPIAINTGTTGAQVGADVAALNGGGFVAVWESGSTVLAQRFDAAGAKLGAELVVNTSDSPSNQNEEVRVAGLDNGGFIVSWDGYPTAALGGSSQDVMAQQFDAAGNKVDGVQVLNDRRASTQYDPEIVGLSSGKAVIVWAGYDQERGTANTYGIYQQLLGTPGSISTSAAPVITDLAASVTFAENLVNSAPQIIDAGIGLLDSDSADFNGGSLWVSVISGYGNVETAQLADPAALQDQFGIRNQGNGPGQVGVAGATVSVGGVAIGTITSGGQNGADLVVSFNANATAALVETLLENLTYANTASAPVPARTVSISLSDGDGGTSAPRTVVINVTPEADGGSPLHGGERVNTYAPATQDNPASARLSDGGYLTVWESSGQDGWGEGVYAQRFDAQGVAVGAEFRINTNTRDSQYEPAVAGLSGGGYVVTWRSNNQDGSGTGVYAQRYANDGAALGAEFLVNTSTDQNQYQATITGTADGGFVIAWYDDYYTNPEFTEYRDIVFQRYNAAGVAQGGETRANPAGEGTVAQYEPVLVGLGGGGFVAMWTDASKDGSGEGVYGQRFDASGTAVGASFRANSYTSGAQSQPAAAALNDGGWIAVWYSEGQDGSGAGVFGQRFAADGSTVGTEFRVNTNTTSTQYLPSVTGLSHGGFAVSYYSQGNQWVQAYDASGARLDGEQRVDTLDNNGNSNASSVVALANGGFVVTFRDYDYNDGSTYNVYQQLFGKPADFTRQANPQLVDVVASVTFDENLVNATPQLIDPVVGLSDADSSNFAGGLLEVNYLTGYALQDQLGLSGLAAQDQLGVRHEGNGAGQVGVAGSTLSFGGVAIGTITSNGVNGSKLAISFNSNASVVAVERVIESLTYANTFSDPAATRMVSIRVTDGDGGASVARSVEINVTPQFDGAQPLFDNERVNSYRPNTQSDAAMSRLADGSYVTVWTSATAQDGWDAAVYGQRFAANGVPLGTEFQVNTYTPFSQSEPTVVGLNGGGFVIAWRSDNQDGNGTGVYAQRYDSAGRPQGGEFRVNTSADQNQYQPSIAATADGGFVVAWYDDYYTNAGFTEYRDIFFQRYNAAGVAQGGETRANPAGLGTVAQYEPSITGLAGGGFVVTWTDDGADGNGNGINGQRFDASGNALGPVFRANTFTTGAQNDAIVTALNDGGFVVTWRSEGQDSNSGGLFSQRYAADGSAVGGEFLVNTTVSGNQFDPAVTALSNGGWAAAWESSGQIFVQQFNAAGERVDGEIKADLFPNASNYAGQPALAALPDGGFVVSFYDYDNATGEYDVYQQVFGNPATLVRQGNPMLVDVNSNVSFGENLVNAVPQLIDAGVGLQDLDSPNFDGGLLEVNYLTGYGAQDQLGQQGLDSQDQLGIRNEGTGPRQVSVAGAVVSYQGVAIGSIVSNGANGNKLTVQFNANATVDAVEQVIESLTYANTVSNPIANRTISIRVTDGDGGASEARTVTINVRPETDGAVKFGLEKVVNTTVAAQQNEPAVARLSDGGYVVVWEDQGGADGNSYGVYGQRFDSNDNAVGAQFRANTVTSGAQYEPQIAALNGGGWVVTWRSDGQDGSSAGVYAQRYAADGSTAGAEFLVNTSTDQGQYQPSITATADGGFVIAWYDDYYTNATFTEYSDVFFQRYDSAGVAVGVETRANPEGLGTTSQSDPSLAGLTGGGFVVIWTDNSADGNGQGVFGQRFSAAGVAVGASFAVNSYVDSTQSGASVAALKDGGFIVTWESANQDLSSTGIYAQRFDASGAKLGAEFRVNTNINGQQYDPEVTGLESGGWVITWTDTSVGSQDVFAQQYDSAGRAVDGETLVNSYRFSTQFQPAVASMADGGFIVTYAGYIASGDGDGNGAPDGGNDTYEIRLQRFSNTAPNIQNVTVTGAEEAVITLSNTLFEGGFTDPDGQSLQAIKIITLPAEGTLRLDGTPVLSGQEISIEQLQAGLLTYQGNVDYFGNDQFRWTGSDGVAFASTPVFTNIVLGNVNDGPRLGTLSDAAGSEGNVFSRTITIGDPDPEAHQVTVNWGDGSSNSVFVTSLANPNISHVYADNGNYTVTVTVNDQQGQGNSIESGSFTATIGNIAPTLPLFGNTTVEQGQVYTLDLGSVNDPGDDDVTEYRINWGDGTPVETYTAATLPPGGILTHTFVAVGPKTITVGLTDEDGVYANAGTKTIDVSAPAEVITVNAGADTTVNEGSFFSRTITFDDPTDQGAAGRSYTVDWGDGQTSSGNLGAGQFSFNIGHSYADNGGPYAVTVSVDDSGVVQQIGSDSFNVVVNNVAPQINISGPGSVAEGGVYTMTLFRNEPGDDTISQYVIDWGDGTVETVLAVNFPANGQFSHVYDDGNITRQIRVSVTDEDGVWPDAGVQSISVVNVAPTAPVSGPATVAEGATYTLNVGAVADPGVDTRTGYTISWGDGTPNQNFTPAQWAAAGGVFTHVYADGVGAGTGRTIVVSASDEDGTHTLGTQSLTITNTTPGLVLSGNANSNEGALYTLNIVGSDVPADVLNYSIDWGDGSALQTLTAAELAALGGNVGHVYSDDEDGPVNTTARTITVTANDGDGGVATQTQNLGVNNVAPTALLSGANSLDEGQTYTLAVAAVVDPGVDTRSSYSIAWGDGSTETFTPAQWAAAAGSFSHVYADGGLAASIVVSATDEDGTFVLGTKNINVNNVAPGLSISGAASTNEGAVYTLAIAGTDVAADVLSYSIDWGDGSAVQTLSAAQLAALSGNVTHTYTDDEDGPVNATPRTITVTANDGDGGITSQTQGVTVNNVAPTAAVTGADSVDEGQPYTLGVTAVVDPGADTRSSYTIAWGDGSTETFTPAQWAAAAGSFTHTYADGAAAASIVVSATDEDGTFVLGSKNVSVNNVAPGLSIGGAASSNEGAFYTLAIAGSDVAADVLSYSIDWGDGSALQTLTAAQLAALSGNVVHTYNDDEDGPVNSTSRTITVTANDGDGGSTARTQNLSVQNVTPTIALGGSGAAIAGQTYTLALGAVTDPGTDTPTSYLIDWGDGSAVQTVAAGSASATHSYASAGSFTIAVSVVDEDGTFAAGSTAVAVTQPSATLSLEAGPNASLAEGSTFTRSINFSDGEDNGAPGWTYSIDYGDGTITTGTTLVQSLDLSHVYADGNAAHTVTVLLTDEAGESASDSFTVTVNNVAPTAAVTGADSVDEGQPYTLAVAAVVDPGADTRSSYSIAWGDGSTETFTPAQWAAAAGSFSHTYVDGADAASIVVSATDEDGTFVLGSKNVSVNNVAPGLVISGATSTLEGAVYTLAIAGTDVAADVLSYSIDWGDGSAVQTLTAAQLAALSGNVTHTFADDEDGPVNATPRTITVTANDGDGGITAQTQGVTVNNVAPTAAVTGADSVDEGQPYTLSVAAVADPGADTRSSYTIAWGDGSTETFTPAQWAAAAGSFSHTYADGAAAASIVVSATDEDGTFVLGSKNVSVNNVAPGLIISGAASSNEGASYTLNIVGIDVVGDELSYTIDWGDGSPVQVLTAAQLATLSGAVTHVFADDEDGPVNATPRNVTVSASDGDGGVTQQGQVVTVQNVGPSIALGGSGAAIAGQTYTLALGAVTDPGTDTPTSYLIDWGDGSAVQTVAAGSASATHSYASAGSFTIAVSVVDEDGTFAAGSTAVAVTQPSATLSLEAGPNASLAEGSTFTRSINFSDGEDNGAPGWTYSIDYGDGTITTGTTLVQSLDLSHVYADGNAAHTVTVLLTDEAGESASDSFTVTVDNVAPTAAVTGADSVDEGQPYTLSVAAVVDPGADTRSSYSIAWGDGSTETFTPAQWAAAAGSFSHTYADGADAASIVVSATDEDGTFVLGSKNVSVNNVAPGLVISGATSTLEGAVYTLAIAGTDVAADVLSYSIDWGDGSAVQTLTAAQLAALSGNVTHTFADDEDGPVNATPRTITVTANDGDGGITSQTQGVTVNNVAPTMAVSGNAATFAGQTYTLNLGAVVDPGQDTPTSYLVDWGDGSAVQTVAAGSASATHVFNSAGNSLITVSVIDEDGTFAAGSQAVNIGNQPTFTVRIGDSVDRLNLATRTRWEQDWTDPSVLSTDHKANATNLTEAWSPVRYTGSGVGVLEGLDIYGGDLGVSGRSLATSTIAQELDGSEALRFTLADDALGVKLSLSRFYLQDDGSVYAEAGLIRLLDSNGNVVGEQAFSASSLQGSKLVTVNSAVTFSTVELWAGAYDGNTFVHGAYAGPGGAVAPYTNASGQHGSDFLLDWVEFTFPEAAPLAGIEAPDLGKAWLFP